MPRIIPAIALASIFGLAATPSATAQTPVAPKGDPKVNPQNLPKASKPPTSTQSQFQTFSAVVLDMRIQRSGEIGEMTVRLAGNNNQNQTIRGCGAKSADHPLLQWAFVNKRLVHFVVTGECLENVLIAAP